MAKNDMIFRSDAINALSIRGDKRTLDEVAERIYKIPPRQSNLTFSKAGYITSLHREYGCNFAEAEKAHEKALEYLRDRAMLGG